MMRLVEIGRFDNAIAAHQMADVLSDAGIQAEVLDENAGSMLPHIGAIGVRVVVRAEDAEPAKAVMAETRVASRSATSEGDDAEAEDDPAGFDSGDVEVEEEAGQEAEAEDEGGDDEDADGLPATADEIAAAEVWARKTRDIAFVGVALVLFAVVALFRVLGPPRGVRESPLASRHLRQATVMAWVGVVVGCVVLGTVWSALRTS